ncbi:hypothetical protein BGZ65_001669, partial [Modicella reniformis]
MKDRRHEHDQGQEETRSQRLLFSRTKNTLPADSCPMGIPEILTMIFSFLDKTSLLALASVSRVWHQAALPLLWRSLYHPSLSPEFMTELSKNGCHVQQLDLILMTVGNSCSVVPTELTRILQTTPRLKNLKLQLSHGATPETISSLLRTISSLLASQLEALTLGIGELNQEDAREFFGRLHAIKKLELIQCATPVVLMAIADAQLEHPSGLCHFSTTIHRSGGIPLAFAFPQERNFDNAALLYLGNGLKNLDHLSIIHNNRLTADGLIDFASITTGLTRLKLECCADIGPPGFEALIRASPSLREVRLGHTQADDQTLMALTTPPTRAAMLKVLSVSRCHRITSFGIQSIVKLCANLLELDFALSPNVTVEIFEEPAWECSKLQKLLMDDIFQYSVAEPAPVQPVP